MNKKNILMSLALALSVVLWSPSAILAGEHGGKEHGGEKHAMHEGSHGMTEEHSATLEEAADILEQEGHADLAKKLEDMAEMKE